MASWNMRSLNQARAMMNLVGALKYGIVIPAIQEIKWRGNNVFDNENYTLCYNGSSGARNVSGMEFFIHKKIKQYITKSQQVDQCLRHFCMKAKFFNIRVICAHTPTEDEQEEIKSAFYDKLDRL
jgi:exonuclease III